MIFNLKRSYFGRILTVAVLFMLLKGLNVAIPSVTAMDNVNGDGDGSVAADNRRGSGNNLRGQDRARAANGTTPVEQGSSETPVSEGETPAGEGGESEQAVPEKTPEMEKSEEPGEIPRPADLNMEDVPLQEEVQGALEMFVDEGFDDKKTDEAYVTETEEENEVLPYYQSPFLAQHDCGQAIPDGVTPSAPAEKKAGEDDDDSSSSADDMEQYEKETAKIIEEAYNELKPPMVKCPGVPPEEPRVIDKMETGFKPKVVYCPLHGGNEYVMDSDEDEEICSFARNNIVDAPQEMTDWIMGAHMSMMDEPSIMVNMWPSLEGQVHRRPKIVGMEIVDSRCVVGSYYRMKVQGKSGGVVTFLVGRNQAEEIMAMKERLLRPAEGKEQKKPGEVRRKSGIVMVQEARGIDEFLRMIRAPSRGPDEVDTSKITKEEAVETGENPFRRYYRNQGYGMGAFTDNVVEQSPSSTTTSQENSSVPSSGGVGLLMGEFSPEGSPM